MSDTQTPSAAEYEKALSDEETAQRLYDELGDWLRERCHNVQEQAGAASGVVFGFTYEGVPFSLFVNTTP